MIYVSDEETKQQAEDLVPQLKGKIKNRFKLWKNPANIVIKHHYEGYLVENDKVTKGWWEDYNHKEFLVLKDKRIFTKEGVQAQTITNKQIVKFKKDLTKLFRKHKLFLCFEQTFDEFVLEPFEERSLMLLDGMKISPIFLKEEE